jgi:FkbM family methyltransferase
MNIYFSQIKQDLNVLNFYKYKRNGYFVDIGANDGKYISNTYLLEKKYNWTGICIEPAPNEYDKLTKCRNCICENVALFNSSGKKLEFKIFNDSVYSGLSNTLMSHNDTINAEYETITLYTKTLTEILDRNNAPQFIEYLSLDTEGSEYDILLGLDTNKYQFGLIHVEHNYFQDIRTKIKDFLLENGYMYVRENEWDDIYIHTSLKTNFSNLFIDNDINNIKGSSIPERFIDIMSDPMNKLIPRVENAGTIENGNIIMWNGVKIVDKCYYDDFSKILELNKGCHEPAEEYLFNEVLKYIPYGATMIELGSYWAFYTISFAKSVKNSINYCIEPELNGLEVGKKNCEINNVSAHFTQAFVGKKQLNITQYVKDNNINYIDILHSDIQGYEHEMLDDIIPLLKQKSINYIFISTHSDELHYNCLKILKEHKYRIIASADFETETFCYDGIILACPSENLQMPEIALGCRKHTPLIQIN